MIKFQPKYFWDGMVFFDDINKYPPIIYSKTKIIESIDDGELGGNFYNPKANWFSVRKNLCEERKFLWDIQTENINVFNGILIKPFITNLLIYTSKYDYNKIYLITCKKCDDLVIKKIAVILIFEKDVIYLIENSEKC